MRTKKYETKKMKFTRRDDKLYGTNDEVSHYNGVLFKRMSSAKATLVAYRSKR